MPLQYHGQAMRRTLVEIEFVRDLTQRQARALTGKHVKNCQRPIQHLDLIGRLGRCLRMWHDVALYERLMQCQQKFNLRHNRVRAKEPGPAPTSFKSDRQTRQSVQEDRKVQWDGRTS